MQFHQLLGGKNDVIYEPRLAFDLRAALVQGVIRALTLALADFISQENKPWSYYLGAALGYTAAATGIPNASASMYVVGSTVDMVFFHSADGSDVQLFLNGILVSTVDTYTDGAPGWVSASVNLAAGVLNRVDIINAPSTNSNKTSSINWLGIGAVTVNGANAEVIRTAAMAHDTIAFRLQDSEADTDSAAFPVLIPASFTRVQIQDYITAIAPEIDALTGAKLTRVEVTIPFDLPGGLKAAPDTNVLNERGGLITFDTSGPNRDSVWIPAMKPAIMPGDSFSLVDAAVAALITRLTTATTAASIRPVTRNEFNWVTARRASRSLRK